jgi:hypothetical protein
MAAGLGFKDFVTGEVLTAADVDGYLMQGIWVFADATARDAAVTSPQEGNACYLKDTNQVLTYSGSAWAAVGGSSPTSFASLNGAGTALTGATTITVSSLSGYNKFFVAITGASSDTADSAFTIRFNADTASNYIYNGLNFNMQAPNILAGSWLAASATATSFPLLGTLQGAAAAQNGSFTIDGANSSGVKIVDLIGINNWQVNGGLSWIYKGYYTGTSVISSISIISSVGNFDAGTIIVYGGN